MKHELKLIIAVTMVLILDRCRAYCDEARTETHAPRRRRRCRSHVAELTAMKHELKLALMLVNSAISLWLQSLLR